MTDDLPNSHEALPIPHAGIRGWVGRPVWNEARAPLELRALRKSPLWEGEGIESGDGRPVLLIPGFMSGEHKAGSLEHVLNKAGYTAIVARVGRNAGPAYRSLDAALEDLISLVDVTGQKARIVGHSRGGQMGRILAVRRPDLVEQVIAVGAPLRTKYPPFFVVKFPAEALDRVWRAGVFGPVYPEREQEVDDDRYRPFPSEVDLASIYSRADGIVDWRYSHDRFARMIEISGSHLGLISSIRGITTIGRELSRSR